MFNSLSKEYIRRTILKRIYYHEKEIDRLTKKYNIVKENLDLLLNDKSKNIRNIGLQVVLIQELLNLAVNLDVMSKQEIHEIAIRNGLYI